jgi:hypothetical protein
LQVPVARLTPSEPELLRGRTCEVLFNQAPPPLILKYIVKSESLFYIFGFFRVDVISENRLKLFRTNPVTGVVSDQTRKCT